MSAQYAQAKPLQVEVANTTAPIAFSLAKQFKHLGPEWISLFNNEQHAIPLSELGNQLRSIKTHSKLSVSSWQAAEKKLIQEKGLDQYTQHILEVRLVNPETVSTTKQPAFPLIAYAPKGNESSWDGIYAYDTQGKLHLLDPYEPPKVPTLVVGIDTNTDLKAGVQLMNDAFTRLGLNANAANNLLHSSSRSDTNSDHSNKFTNINRIYVLDDKEPWVKGKAEFYALVSGIDAKNAKPLMSVVEMPYLTQKEQEYRPNQMVIAWGQYRFNAANVMLYEQDGNYNYKALVSHLVEATATIINMTGQPDIATLVNLGNTIIQIMPDSWYEDADDFVDAFYTVERGKLYEDYSGAANNVTATLSPFDAQQ
jgi:hypothetical protein